MMAALAIMWFYDLHLNTAAYLSRELPGDLYALRGAVLALLVGLFALGMRRSDRLKVQLSRAATFQSLSLLAILVYLILMMSTSRAVELAGGNWLEVAQVALLVAMSAATIVLVPSSKARRWLSVTLQKHLFQHRYDYRQEWLRFTATIGSDSAPLEQALDHLVQNAIEASDDRPVRIDIRRHGGRVEIAVADEGCGMSPDFVATRLFQPFVSTKSGGFGLGAHEARSLVEGMGGSMRVDSRPGGGTTFTISLPAAEPVTLARPEPLTENLRASA
jgi:signal transduction histidine kinase